MTRETGRKTSPNCDGEGKNVGTSTWPLLATPHASELIWRQRGARGRCRSGGEGAVLVVVVGGWLWLVVGGATAA